MSQRSLRELTKSYRQMSYEDLRRFVGDKAGRTAVVQAQGEALRSRYLATQTALQQIMDFVGFGPSNFDPDTKMYTYGVNLGTGKNGNDAEGMYVGYLSRTHYEGLLYPLYAFSAHFDRGDGLSSSRDTVTQEFSHPQTFGWGERLGWDEESLAAARKSHEPLLELAEETTVMLWNAIGDPGLNPKFAAQLVARDARAARAIGESSQA